MIFHHLQAEFKWILARLYGQFVHKALMGKWIGGMIHCPPVGDRYVVLLQHTPDCHVGDVVIGIDATHKLPAGGHAVAGLVPDLLGYDLMFQCL